MVVVRSFKTLASFFLSFNPTVNFAAPRFRRPPRIILPEDVGGGFSYWQAKAVCFQGWKSDAESVDSSPWNFFSSRETLFRATMWSWVKRSWSPGGGRESKNVVSFRGNKKKIERRSRTNVFSMRRNRSEEQMMYDFFRWLDIMDLRIDSWKLFNLLWI